MLYCTGILQSPMFSLALNHFLTLPTIWKKLRLSVKEGDLPILESDTLNFFFLPIAETAVQPMGKISRHTPAAEGLILESGFPITGSMFIPSL